jgi:hypothetical protein
VCWQQKCASERPWRSVISRGVMMRSMASSGDDDDDDGGGGGGGGGDDNDLSK